MKRNDDLLRDMLLRLEALPAGTTTLSGEFKFETHDRVTVGEHALLLLDAGLVVGRDISTKAGPAAVIVRLTNHGHDFLRVIREDTVWRRTKRVLAPVGGASLDIIKSVATEVITQTLGGAE